jgi:hypothetical protein
MLNRVVITTIFTPVCRIQSTVSSGYLFGGLLLFIIVSTIVYMSFPNRTLWSLIFIITLLATSVAACAPAPSQAPTSTLSAIGKTRVLTKSMTPYPSTTPTHILQSEPVATQLPTATEVRKKLTSTPTPPSSSTTSAIMPAEITPLSSNDLLFIAQGSLMRWNSESQKIENWVVPDHLTDLPDSSAISTNYPGKILSYSKDDRVSKIALLRSEGITANGVELFNIDLLDIASGETWTIIDNSRRINRMQISPDGEWIAYQKDEDQNRISLVPTSEESIIVETSISSDGSRILADFEWSPDSRFIAWIDSNGLWLSDTTGFQPRLVVSNTIGMTYYGGEQSEIRVEFESLDWSPQGRYILSKVNPLQSEVSWMGIVDTDRGLVSEVPGSFRSEGFSPNVEWTSEGDLLIVKGWDQDEASSPSLEVWRVVPTYAGLVAPEIEINLGNLLNSEPANSALLEHDLAFPRRLDYRHYSFITVPVDPSDEAYIFVYDTISQELEVVCELPAGTVDVTWSGDGQAAIVVGKHNSALIATLDNNAYDLHKFIGMDSCCFDWYAQ